MTTSIIAMGAFVLGMLAAGILLVIFLPDPDDLRRTPDPTEDLQSPGKGGNLRALWGDPLEMLGLVPHTRIQGDEKYQDEYQDLELENVRVLGEFPPTPLWDVPDGRE